MDDPLNNTAEARSSKYKDKDKKKKSKKSKHHDEEGDPAEAEQRRRERKERKKEKKEKRKDKHGKSDLSPVPVVDGLKDRDKSPSWTRDALIPSVPDQMNTDMQMLKATRQSKEINGKSESKPKKMASFVAPKPAADAEPEEGELVGSGGGQAAEELSIEETNKVRAALGLKPLDVGKPGSGTATKTKQEDVHAPPVNISQVKKAEKVQEKLKTIKEKNQLERKVKKTKGLGKPDDDEEDVNAWVQKSRKLEDERKKADFRAQQQQEMDEDADEPATRPANLPYYSSRDLSGLVVEHDLQRFQSGENVILTLKDSDVLKDEEGDVLVSTALTESEKLSRNLENKKKKPAYNPYEDADAMDQPELLKKYDEVIDGERKRAFVLDSSGTAQVLPSSSVPAWRASTVHLGQVEDLVGAGQSLAKDYYNEQEMAAKFKKVKRGKGTKSRKADVKEETGRSRIVDYDDMPDVKPDIKPSIEDEEDSAELQHALNRARRLQQAERILESESLITSIKPEPEQATMSAPLGNNIVFLDETSEFCRAVGGLPTVRANREEAEMVMYRDREDVEEDMDVDEEEREAEEKRKGGWSEVQFEAEPANLGSDEEGDGDGKRPKSSRSGDGSSRSKHTRSILDDEPTADRGIGAALRLAMKKGLLEERQEEKDKRHLAAVHKKNSSIPEQTYTIEDKVFDDDKRGRHERYQGPVVAFKDKSHYQPSFKLEYHDATGRKMDAKDAFRDLSHKFHGKGPGKLKTEKRGKKYAEEKLLMEMSSVDTPLHTLEKLINKQQETQSPFVLLSGPSVSSKDSSHPISKRYSKD